MGKRLLTRLAKVKHVVLQPKTLHGQRIQCELKVLANDLL